MNKIERLYNQLLKKHGPQGWWPVKGQYSVELKNRKKTSSEKFEIAVGAILTQNTSWKNAQKAIDALRTAKLLSKKAILSTPKAKLAGVIKSSGYHNQKAKKLKAFCAHNGKINREGLLSIWGIGPETADSILLYAYDVPVFVIDAYTKRLLKKLGWISGKESYGEVQEVFHKNLPRKASLFNEFHALIVAEMKK